MSEKHQKKLRGHEAELQQMLRLVTSILDVPLTVTEEELRYSGPESDKLIKLYRDFEFTRFLKKYETSVGAKAEAAVVENQPLETGVKLQKLTLKASVSELGSTEVFILLKTGAPSLFGPGIEWLLVGDREGYVNYDHPTAEEMVLIREKLEGAKTLVGHDLKTVRHAVQFENNKAINLDVMVMAYLLNPGGRGLSFGEIVKDTLNIDVSGDEGEKMLSALPELLSRLEAELKRDEMFELYQKMDAPLISVLYKMESWGVLVDRQRLEGLQQKFSRMIEILTEEITVLAGRSFNINSPSQIAEVLFETLGLPTKGLKKTKSGYSTAAAELEKLWEAHPIIAKISEYREVSKLKSTYADTLPALIKADGRIHTSLNQCVAATGRLSSSDPNLQNIPIRTELGREIRAAFVAPSGKLLLSIDYSQIELRLAAAMANDQAFLKAFAEGVDIHTQTAAEIWGVPLEKVSKQQRSAAKAINFSILYGVGPRALARATGSTFEEAKIYIEKYFKAHEAIRDYMEAQKLQAKNLGYVTTFYGRRRYLPEIESAMPQVRAQAERMAINMPIQGTEADILKLAMLEVERVIEAEKLPAKLLLQVHDELLFEVEELSASLVAKRLAEVMSGVVSMKVNLLVDTALSPDWGTME